MRVIVCGDREWTDRELIRQRLAQLPAGTVVVHGACRGADMLADSVARELGLRPESHPAMWGRDKKAAGAIRNRKMLRLGAELVIAFHDDLEGRSRGTKDMVGIARKAGVEVEWWRHADGGEGEVSAN